ncbi:hypothetical protein NHH82_21425 [Oxalobacteraceae bacterium OTU3REALA1]|nr:hypothetical protein NHH82_21425 [Oxalobacteraceae bacterium OTU3REALA1]
MTEIGGPTTQAGIRYQDRVVALYLGRMIDARQRHSRHRPIEVRIESPDKVDDFVVHFDDGSRQFFQVKMALQRTGNAWVSLWRSMHNQPLSPADSLSLILGEPSTAATDLRALSDRTDGADAEEWSARLTSAQRDLAASIARAINAETAEVFQLFKRIEIRVVPAAEIDRDYVPIWIPESTVAAARLFEALTQIAWEGAETRGRFHSAGLRDRLNSQFEITITTPASWGLASYLSAVVSLATIEVPGTDFRPAQAAEFLWPRGLRFDRNKRVDFDDDLPRWRDFMDSEEIDLRNFPSNGLNAMVVIAGPGFGKSTLVHAIARKTSIGGLIPAIIPVTSFSDSGLTIDDYLQQIVNRDFSVQIDWKAAAVTGALVLFVDGLDEVSSEKRTLVIDRLKVYCAAHPEIRWMLTVRDAAALPPLLGATMIELAPLRDAEIRQYVEFYRPGEPDLADTVLARIVHRTDLAHLVRIPIFLALMLVMRLESEDLRRSDLLESYIETLFRPSEFKRIESESLDVESLRRIVERAAFMALETDSVGVSKQLFSTCAKDIDPSVSPDEAREALIRRGVLRRTSLVRLSFPFPIVQEYLASRELLDLSNDQLAQRLKMMFKRPWAQALQFALERHPDSTPTVAQILAQDDDAFYTGLRLTGRCLANGMQVTPEHREDIGNRLAAIWGCSSWQTNKLVNGIIVDAFSRPLHSAIRAKLGDRYLLHNGAGTIVALNRDRTLSISVVRELISGNIDGLLNISDLQDEVDRLGTEAFVLYVERYRSGSGGCEEADAISCLIGHMKYGCIDSDMAYHVAADDAIPLQIRLAAWSKSGRNFDSMIERLIIEGLSAEDYHRRSTAARALACSTFDASTIVRLLSDTDLPPAGAQKGLEYLIFDWCKSDNRGRIQELLALDHFTGPLRNVALLYSMSVGDMAAFEQLLGQFDILDIEFVSATLTLVGHFPERDLVDRIVAAIANRPWTGRDRASIADALAIGLTHRVSRFSLSTSSIEPIPFHPGRAACHDLFKTWLILDEYQVIERLRLVLDAIRVGLESAQQLLRPALDAALEAGAGGDTNDSILAGRAIEILHTNGDGLSEDELEMFVKNCSYNLATSAVALIAARGTQDAVNMLTRLYHETDSALLKPDILTNLEPLASRLGLRIMRTGNTLSSVPA